MDKFTKFYSCNTVLDYFVFLCFSWVLMIFFFLNGNLYATLAGGRPNTFSGGHNAFAGVVNPANAVWIKDRFDIGLFVVHQKSTFDNKNNNPLFPLGKINQTYKTPYIYTVDAALHKKFIVQKHECSISLATYVTPGVVDIRTKTAFPISGTTPIRLQNQTRAVSLICSIKLNENHSIGLGLDYFFLAYKRNGFQRTDNPLRSVSPGHVTNNGTDHSQGFGLSLGWRLNITKDLMFGIAFVKKSYIGQLKKYKGFEPHHARNYIPASLGAGFTYHFNQKIAGRLEVLWTGFGSLPNANNAILSNGNLNTNKRGSNKSPGSGLQDATVINAGIGYKINDRLSSGLGYSHRIKLSRKSPYIISHNYLRQTIFDLLTLGFNFNYKHHDLFLTLTHGFPNKQSGSMPEQIGGGKFSSKKCYDALSFAWGYLY
jgi:long-chain fatty acid transport protein